MQDGYWHGSAVGEVAHWRERALRAEARVKELEPDAARGRAAREAYEEWERLGERCKPR